ncbi:MAG: tRNA uridine-5-carboxymethylaminomethyl(34) synthesis enzyme MnmG [Candidatus Sericytochromatia bacterium]|nr:tRNA uridine-5-carboxymethylaminomethyl(34) synthesis enzyme MnmG [Candidatus Sericytochromatia bacterium]
MSNPVWDVIVIGGGHAGVESALASSRLGANTLMVTLNLSAIATMPCNPAIGGPAKGHLVREIDALGGEMGKAADATALQVRVLNESKGPAVQALRAQSDKARYSAYMTDICHSQPNLSLKEGHIDALEVGADGELILTSAQGETLRARAVVVTTGTFLNGICHTGDRQTVAGRAGEPSAQRFSDSLRKLGFELHRLKTGTPPRLDAATIDYQRMSEEQGDEAPPPFCLDHDPTRPPNPLPRLSCWLTHTTLETHAVIQANLHRSPIYGGQIASIGPRYCPSIEDKVVRFPDKESHPVFVEPETALQDVMYLQGCSTSLPEDVQDAFVRTIPGLEQVRIVRYGYAVEYDCIPATQLHATLMTKQVPGLFTAGQINGTSGYEEAAAQGLVAGINAAHWALGRAPVVIPRTLAYIGTLIDDLVTKDIRDPYRMLTSRSEHRLTLRQDNADQRLTPLGREIGLIDDERWRRFEAKCEAIAQGLAWLKQAKVYPGSPLAQRLQAQTGESIERVYTREELLRRPPIPVELLLPDPEEAGFSLAPAVAWQLSIEVKYEGYIKRQQMAIERQQQLESKGLPADLDYRAIKGLSREAQDKLDRIRPRTIGQASRVGGVTPADISLLLVFLALSERKERDRLEPVG